MRFAAPIAFLLLLALIGALALRRRYRGSTPALPLASWGDRAPRSLRSRLAALA